MYIRLVQRTGADLKLNRKFIVAQVINLLVYAIYWVIFGICYTANHKKLRDYGFVKRYVILDGIGMGIVLINFFLIAHIFYRSSQVYSSESDVSLLSYLKDTYINKEKAAFVTLASLEDDEEQVDNDARAQLITTVEHETNQDASETGSDLRVERSTSTTAIDANPRYVH